ncbi:hypothetical protein ACFUCV_03740 [Specibacter sp. NPDC057265]|uniref:hypothetical protein n=1 Tax=Specibacter sp. NPDC057265 TaxID=3346075 RepID=UPI003640D647
MFTKTKTTVAMGVLVLALTACSPGGSTNGGSSNGGSSNGQGSQEAQNLQTAISAVDNVSEVTARYTVKSGMGSTVNVRITAAAGTPSLETVMTDSLTAFAGAAEGIKTTAGVSFQVTESGADNTINPTAVGLQQSPTVAEIIDFAGL